MPSDAAIEILVERLRFAPSADNMQPLRFSWDGDGLRLLYDSERVAGQTFAAGAPATLLAAGACLALLQDLATDMGLEPVVETGPSQENGATVYAVIRFTGDADETPRATQQRHTNRGPYKRQALPADLLDEIAASGTGVSRTLVYSDPASVARVARSVRSASELRFRIREVHEWLAHSLRFTDAEVDGGDGLDVKTLGLPPGGAMFLRFIGNWGRMRALNRIGAYKLVSAIDSAPVASAPAMVAIIGPRDDAKGVMDAGRQLHSVWQRLNGAGLAVHPYYVVSDQLQRLQSGAMPAELLSEARSMEEEATALFDLQAGETLHMLLRTGWPGKPARRSRRLPLKRIYAGPA